MKMKWENHGIKTPLARARGLGSAHHGSGHWMAERISSLALIPLVIWVVYSMVSLAGADYEAFTLWQAKPLNGILMLLFIAVSFYHAALGCQVIMDDYIHHEGLKMISVILMKMAFAALGVACVFFGSSYRLRMSACQKFFCFLIFLSFTSVPALAKKSMFFANKIPDFSQTEIDEEIHGYGVAYCAPTAASNVLRWLHKERMHQGKLIKLLASSEYMDTDIAKGTTFPNFIQGVSRYMNDYLGGYKSLQYQGMGYVQPEFDTGIYIPDLDWIADSLGMKKAGWLRLGYYDYDEETKTYTRNDGHIVNLVGYNLSPRDNILVIHDPGAVPDKNIINFFLDVHFLEDGVIKYGDAPAIPAKGHLFVENSENMYPHADAVILEGAVRLETN